MTQDNEEPSAASAGSVAGDLRNGALSTCETVPDADSRVWETYPPVCHVPSQKNLTLTDAEREAIEGMAAYFDTRGNITLQAWGSLLRVLLMRWK